MRPDGSAACGGPWLASGLPLACFVLACVAAPWLSLTPPARAEGTAAATTEDEPAPVTLVRPTDGTVVPDGRHGARIGLAWRGLHGSPILYFVEVLASNAGETREVFSGYTRQTELRVRLDGAGRYAWRVVAVDRASAHYSVSPWRFFTVEDAAEVAR